MNFQAVALAALLLLTGWLIGRVERVGVQVNAMQTAIEAMKR